jgi:hypothetical protein
MAMLPPPNVTFDLYRQFCVANPYTPPNRPAAFTGLQGYLRHHVRNGRFGYVLAGNVPIHWTNVLLVPLSEDLRDAYLSELGGSTIADGDTVMVADYPVAGTCTAFVIVLVQRQARGTPRDHFRCYLDRAAPLYGSACPDPTATDPTCAGGVLVPCCPGVGLPGALQITLSNGTGTCTCLNGQSWQVDWNGVDWSNPYVLCGHGGSWDLACTGTPPRWKLTSTGCDFITPAVVAASCNPLSITWAGVSVLGCCNGTIDIAVTP